MFKEVNTFIKNFTFMTSLFNDIMLDQMKAFNKEVYTLTYINEMI